ncbi:hypothetical protein [Siminovitchia terrae]|nr:hypothetical protein [Siminovitchia terrae]
MIASISFLAVVLQRLLIIGRLGIQLVDVCVLMARFLYPAV